MISREETTAGIVPVGALPALSAFPWHTPMALPSAQGCLGCPWAQLALQGCASVPSAPLSQTEQIQRSRSGCCLLHSIPFKLLFPQKALT